MSMDSETALATMIDLGYTDAPDKTRGLALEDWALWLEVQSDPLASISALMLAALDGPRGAEIAAKVSSLLAPPPLPPDLERVLLATSRASGVSIADLLGRSRPREVTAGRELFAHTARSCTNASWPEIGRALQKDHTSVMAAARRFASSLASGDSRAATLEARMIADLARE